MDEAVSKRDKGSSQPDTNGNKNTGSNSSAKSSTSEERGRTSNSNGKQDKQISQNSLVKAPKVVSVEVPNAEKEKEKTEEAPKKNPRGAGRKKGSVSNRKSTAAIKVMNKEDIKQLLIVTTSMFASKEGMEIWALTDKEADQLAEPLANILARNEAFSKVAGANGDAMALVLAAFLIFVPKFMMWNATRPKKRKKGEEINYGNGTEHINNGKSAKQQKGKVSPISEPPSRQSTGQADSSNGKNSNSPTGFGGAIGGLISPLAGI